MITDNIYADFTEIENDAQRLDTTSANMQGYVSDAATAISRIIDSGELSGAQANAATDLYNTIQHNSTQMNSDLASAAAALRQIGQFLETADRQAAMAFLGLT